MISSCRAKAYAIILFAADHSSWRAKAYVILLFASDHVEKS
jgi:hypothetical protein